MGSYVASVLATGENVVYETRLHWKIYIVPIVFFWLILPPILAFITRRTSEFAVTSKRVIVKTGFISRKAFDTSLDKIEGIFIEQSICDRILGCGTVIVRGTGSHFQPIKDIADPFTFKRMIDEAVEARRTKLR